MDALTALVDMASNSICAILVVLVLLSQERYHRSSNKQRDEIERMVRDIMRARNGRDE